jgi:hypothetical protein
MYPTYHLSALTRWLTGPRIVMSGRRDLRGMAQPLGAVGRAIETTARRMTDLIVANSHAVEADTIAEHPAAGHLRVIYNGVEPVPSLARGARGRRREWASGRTTCSSPLWPTTARSRARRPRRRVRRGRRVGARLLRS